MVRGPPTMSTTVRAKTASPLPLASPGHDCPCQHEHYVMEALDEVFFVDIDEMFTMLFTDSPLFREFVKRRKTYDVRLAPWPDAPDTNGEKVRTIYYTLSINYSIGPKCSPSTERQVIYPESKPGERYLIDADCVNGGVPYSDHFSTVIRYCMTTLAPGQTRLYITGRVVYHKNVWGVVRGFIEKTAVSGLAESFGVMADLLRDESSKNAPVSATAVTAPKPNGSSVALRPSTLPLNGQRSPDDGSVHAGSERRVRMRGSGGRRGAKGTRSSGTEQRTDEVVLSPATSTENDLQQRHDPFADEYSKDSLFWSNFNRDPAELLVVLLFIVIIALVIVNAVLYYQVTALELTVARTILRERIAR